MNVATVASDLVLPLGLLSLGLGMACGACIVITRLALVTARRALNEARESLTRAALAESALAELRHRRSAAVAKGNQTRAQMLAARRRAMTDELRQTVAVKRTPPQGALPLDLATVAGTEGGA